MRLVTFEVQGVNRLGAEQEDAVVDLNRGYGLMLAARGVQDFQGEADRDLPADMLRFLEGWEQTELRAREVLAFAASVQKAGGPLAHALIRPASEVRLHAPISNPQKVICLGLNYRDHAKETNSPIPSEPVLFSKFSSAIIGPEDPIVLPSVSQQVDYEAELACIIGRRGRHIPKEQGLEYVAGYTVFHDVSARDYQIGKPGGQWLAGKTFDTFAPLGPALVTKDDVPDPHVLDIRCTVNGEVLQSSNTRHLIFSVEDLIAYCSHIFTLEPGDVIATGTPGGIGFTRKPQRFLKHGDVVVIEVARLGALRNPVRSEGR